MRAAISVNRSREGQATGQAVRPCAAAVKNSVYDADYGAYVTEHVDATTRTLAPQSRHIVASGLSGTTSRAAVLSFIGPVFG
mgnify:CR=1 FL=1